MNITRLNSICVEIYKALCNLNPCNINEFHDEIYEVKLPVRVVRGKHKFGIVILEWNQVNFRSRNLNFCPQISIDFH